MKQILDEYGALLITSVVVIIIVAILIGTGGLGNNKNVVSTVGRMVDTEETGNKNLDISASVRDAAGTASYIVSDSETKVNTYYNFSHFTSASGEIKKVKIQSIVDEHGNEILMKRTDYEAAGSPSGYAVVDTSSGTKIKFTKTGFSKIKFSGIVKTDKNTAKTMTQTISLEVVD